LAAGAAGVTMVEDREADFYEAFACRPERVDIVARVPHNRTLIDGAKLYDAGQTRSDMGRIPVDLPATPGRKARTATLVVRAGMDGSSGRSVTMPAMRRPCRRASA